MLIENAPKANKTFSLKLVTGEELIAKLLEYTTDYIRIKNPMSLVMVSAPEGENSPGHVAFAPWMLAPPEDQVYTIKTSNIIHICEVRPEAASQYKKAVNEPQTVGVIESSIGE